MDNQLDLFSSNSPEIAQNQPLTSSDELMEKWGTAEGQLWKVGLNFFYCGDATNPDSWRILLDAADVHKVKGIFTSPPYGNQRLSRYGGVEPEDYVTWFMCGIDPQLADSLDITGSFFLNLQAATVNGRRLTYDKALVLELEAQGWVYFEEYSWIKPARPGAYRKRFKNGREPVHQFVFDPERLEDNIEAVFEHRHSEVSASWKALRVTQGIKGASRSADNKAYVKKVRPSNVLKIQHEHIKVPGNDHPARFPVKLPEFFIRAYSFPGEYWLDPFAGSFTTILAAHRNTRQGLGIEIRPEYVAIGLERFKTLYGITGELL